MRVKGGQAVRQLIIIPFEGAEDMFGGFQAGGAGQAAGGNRDFIGIVLKAVCMIK